MLPRAVFVVVVAVLAMACRDGLTPTSPSQNPTPQPTPTPTSRVSFTGRVTVGGDSGFPLRGATVRILGGANEGHTATTNQDGAYVFNDLEVGNANVSASAPNFRGAQADVYIDGTNTLDFRLEAPPWAASGTGSDVVDVPAWVKRVRIGLESQDRSNRSGVFTIRLAGRIILNLTVASCGTSGTGFTCRYHGVHLMEGGGTVEVTDSSSKVRWELEWLR